MPNAQTTPRFSPLNLQPTAPQLALQLSKDKAILVDANAGAGKTTSLALRIAELLEEQKVQLGACQPNRILTLTYTEIGKLALQRTLKKIGVHHETVKQLWIDTFDGFSKYILRFLEGSEPRYIRNPEHLRPYIADAIEYFRDRLSTHPDRDLVLPGYSDGGFDEYFLRESFRIKGKMVIPKALWLEESVDQHLADREGEDYTVLKLLHHIESLRRPSDYELPLFRSEGDATYDLARLIGDMAQDNPQGELQRWPHHLWAFNVDEMHDMNEAMFTIVRRLLQSNPRALFCGVGDPDQVLHQKAGAEPRFMDEVLFSRETGRKVSMMTLPGTFRFSEAVAQMAQALAGKAYQSAARHPTAVNTYFYDQASTCARQVFEAATRWQEKGGAMEQFVVLLRHPHQSVAIENALLMLGMPYRVFPFQTYLHRPEVLLLRALFAISSQQAVAIESRQTLHRMIDSLADFCQVEIPHRNDPSETRSERVAIAVDELFHEPQRLQQFVTNVIIRKSEPYVERRLAAAMAVAREAPDEGTLERLIKAVDMPALAAHRWVEKQRQVDAVAHLKGLMDASSAFAGGAAAFFDQLNQMELAYERQYQPKARSLILTDIPSVKGFEFDHVVIPFIENGEFPASDGGTADDEKNMLYVALTRCRKELTLIFSEANPGPFLEDLFDSGFAERRSPKAPSR